MQNPQPPALTALMNLGSAPAPAAPAAQQQPAQTGLASGMNAQPTFVPSYQGGGMIGPGGMPDTMGAPTGVGLAEQGQLPQGGMSPEMLQMQVSQFAAQHPQQVDEIRAALLEAIQSGEMTQPELNMIVQLATVAAQNPEMYPYVRNFAIQNGIATEQDLPAQYDQGLVFVLLLAARALQDGVGGQDMMQGGSPAMAGGAPMGGAPMGGAPMGGAPMGGAGPIPSMAKGGMTPASKKADGSVLINAHEGEYVIPANVVKMKGKEFFDSLVEKYRGNQ